MWFKMEIEDNEINFRAWLIFALFIGTCLYFIIPVFTQTPTGYYKDASGNNVKIPEGYITAENGTPIPLIFPTPIIIEKTITITPTPDNGIYYASETQQGIRKLQRYFVFHRNDVLGKKDLDFHVTVYGYKFLDSYHFWNLGDNQYYEVVPMNQNCKFLFVYVQMYSDDISGDDVRNYIPNENHYQVKYNDMLYQPIPFTKELRIYELENTYNFNDDHRIEYYGQFVFQALTGKEAGKPVSMPLEYSLGGKSNAIDGYIVYEIPIEATENDIQVWGEFYAYGNSQWVMKN